MMNGRTFYHLVLADVLERTRRRSFLLTLAAAIYLGFAVNAGYIIMHLGEYRGIYNSAWIGTLTALSTVLFVSLAGFYVIKNAIDRDLHTRVGQILAATPISKLLYIMAKITSNFVVLLAILFIQALSAVIMQLIQQESAIEMWELLSPFLLIAVPAMAILAGIAVLFESIPFLRGGFGNVFYFFLWGIVIAIPLESKMYALDFSGILYVDESLLHAVEQIHDVKPGYENGFSLNAGPPGLYPEFQTFVWSGLEWTPLHLGYRFLWFVYTFFVGVIASFFFNRFDATPMERRRMRAQGFTKKLFSPITRPLARLGEMFAASELFSFRSNFGQMLAAEVRLMIKGLPGWYYLILLGLTIATLTAPLDAVRDFLFPILWLLPVLLWSGMGMREARFRTDQLLFSSPRMLTRQFPALWLAGVVVALLAASGVAVRFFIEGEWSLLYALAIGALFIPSLALMLGVWSGTGKVFEALYVLLWYIGPMNRVPAMDYMGITPVARMTGIPLVFLMIALLFLVVAFIGRRRRVGG